LLFELLDLTALVLDFLLLCVNSRLRPVLADLLILQFVSDQETATRTERTADRGTRSW
jgi:hypothetical protein